MVATAPDEISVSSINCVWVSPGLISTGSTDSLDVFGSHLRKNYRAWKPVSSVGLAFILSY